MTAAIAIAIAATALVAGCGGGSERRAPAPPPRERTIPVDVLAASARGRELRLATYTYASAVFLPPAIAERGEAIRVRLRIVAKSYRGAGAARCVRARLRAPVGRRIVVDATRGEEVALDARGRADTFTAAARQALRRCRT